MGCWGNVVGGSGGFTVTEWKVLRPNGTYTVAEWVVHGPGLPEAGMSCPSLAAANALALELHQVYPYPETLSTGLAEDVAPESVAAVSEEPGSGPR